MRPGMRSCAGVSCVGQAARRCGAACACACACARAGHAGSMPRAQPCSRAGCRLPSRLAWFPSPGPSARGGVSSSSRRRLGRVASPRAAAGPPSGLPSAVRQHVCLPATPGKRSRAPRRPCLGIPSVAPPRQPWQSRSPPTRRGRGWPRAPWTTPPPGSGEYIHGPRHGAAAAARGPGPDAGPCRRGATSYVVQHRLGATSCSTALCVAARGRAASCICGLQSWRCAAAATAPGARCPCTHYTVFSTAKCARQGRGAERRGPWAISAWRDAN